MSVAFYLLLPLIQHIYIYGSRHVSNMHELLREGTCEYSNTALNVGAIAIAGQMQNVSIHTDHTQKT